MKPTKRKPSPTLGLLGLICMAGFTLSCSNPQPSQQEEPSQTIAAPVQETPPSTNAVETPDRNTFSGRYSAMNEETGENYLLNVQLDEGKLMLMFRGGGTEEFGYKEKSIEKKTNGAEYLVRAEDLDGNGALSFLFKCNPEGKTTEVVVTWLDDAEMKPMVLTAE